MQRYWHSWWRKSNTLIITQRWKVSDVMYHLCFFACLLQAFHEKPVKTSSEHTEQALSTQGVLAWDSFRESSTRVTRLSGCMGNVTIKLSVIPTSVSVQCESGSCSQFLHQRSLMFSQQPHTYCTDKSKTAFVMSLLADKTSAWALTIPPVCSTYQWWNLWCDEECFLILSKVKKPVFDAYSSYIRVQIQFPNTL